MSRDMELIFEGLLSWNIFVLFAQWDEWVRRWYMMTNGYTVKYVKLTDFLFCSQSTRPRTVRSSLQSDYKTSDLGFSAVLP